VRHALATIKAAIFLGGPVPMVPPRLKVGVDGLCEEHQPSALKLSARVVKYGRDAMRVASLLYLLAIAVPRKPTLPFGSSQSPPRERLWIDNGREQPRLTIFLNVSPIFFAL
jgi:hypothetical protein